MLTFWKKGYTKTQGAAGHPGNGNITRNHKWIRVWWYSRKLRGGELTHLSVSARKTMATTRHTNDKTYLMAFNMCILDFRYGQKLRV